MAAYLSYTLRMKMLFCCIREEEKVLIKAHCVEKCPLLGVNGSYAIHYSGLKNAHTDNQLQSHYYQKSYKVTKNMFFTG